MLYEMSKFGDNVYLIHCNGHQFDYIEYRYLTMGEILYCSKVSSSDVVILDRSFSTFGGIAVELEVFGHCNSYTIKEDTGSYIMFLVDLDFILSEQYKMPVIKNSRYLSLRGFVVEHLRQKTLNSLLGE